MKISTLAVLSVLSFSQAHAFDISNICDITKNQIKDTLNQKSLNIRQAEREMLRMLSPEIDQRKLDDLIQDVQDNKYNYENQVITYSETEKLKELKLKEWAESQIPSKEEHSRYQEIMYNSRASERDLQEMQAIAKRIQNAKNFEYKLMTESEKAELSLLTAKSVEHDKRQKNRAQAELNLNNYIRSEVLNKISTNPETEVYNYGEGKTAYNLKSQNVNIEVRKDQVDQREVSKSAFNDYYSHPFSIDHTYNRTEGDSTKIAYDIISRGKTLDVYLTPSRMEGDNEYNKALKEIALNTEKTWTDFGAPSLDSGWGVKISKEIVDIAGDVKSSLDLATGKISVQYRTMIFNKDGKWLNFPEQYVSLEEMTDLLLPKECRSVVKDAGTSSAVSDVSRGDTKKPEAKRSFLKKIFGGKNASKQ